MAESTYEIGGIFNAIKQSDDKNDSSDEADLTDLFSFKPEEKSEDEDEIPDERLDSYLNPKEIDPEEKSIKPKKKKKKKKNEEEKKKKPEEPQERKERTVFVGNVALTVTKKDLKKLFSKFGDVETVRIRSVPRADLKTPRKVAFIKKEFHSGRESMNAYIVYKDTDGANKALQCNGKLLEEMHLRVDLSENKKHDTNATIFVGNLPFNANEEKLRDHFTKCGEVDDVRMIRDKATGIGKGIAYVRFKSKDGVMFGLKLNSSEFGGRQLRVSKAKADNNSEQKDKFRNKKFQGLRSTSKKHVEMGKKLFGSSTKKTSWKNKNAAKRIKNKNSKSKQKGEMLRKQDSKKAKKKK